MPILLVCPLIFSWTYLYERRKGQTLGPSTQCKLLLLLLLYSLRRTRSGLHLKNRIWTDILSLQWRGNGQILPSASRVTLTKSQCVQYVHWGELGQVKSVWHITSTPESYTLFCIVTIACENQQLLCVQYHMLYPKKGYGVGKAPETDDWNSQGNREGCIWSI